ncbi:MAG: hypothetical protein ACYTF1_00225, partial [Planctomycetota bacterium]
FKLGLHGAQLNLAAMIGYIQDRTAGHWHDKINGWISELVSGLIKDGCVWTTSEALVPLKEDTTKDIASYRSIHCRTGDVLSNEIKLHHLWIVMNGE